MPPPPPWWWVDQQQQQQRCSKKPRTEEEEDDEEEAGGGGQKNETAATAIQKKTMSGNDSSSEDDSGSSSSDEDDDCDSDDASSANGSSEREDRHRRVLFIESIIASTETIHRFDRNADETTTAFPFLRTDNEDNEIARQRFTTFCVENIPGEADCKDCVVMLSVLAQMGLLDRNLLDDYESGDLRTEFGRWNRGKWECIVHRRDIDREETVWSCTIDNDDGRIVAFDTRGTWGTRDEMCDVPTDIVRLERLEELLLEYVRSLPSLRKLPRLRKITLVHSGGWDDGENDDVRNNNNVFNNNFPVGVTLANLKEFNLENCDLRRAPALFDWMAERLPNLERLGFNDSWNESDEIIDYIETLRGRDWSFGENLKTLTIENSGLDDESFRTLFLDIMPAKFPNLSTLDLQCNAIESLRPIVDEIEKNNNAAAIASSKPSSSSAQLRRLDLSGNPFMTYGLQHGTEYADEKENVLSLLDAFEKIFSIGSWDPGEGVYPPDVQYALAINHAGQHLLLEDRRRYDNNNRDGGGNGEKTNDNITTTIDDNNRRPPRSDNSFLPLALCPRLLERAYRNSNAIRPGAPRYANNKRDATGVHYLLLHGLLASGHIFAAAAGGVK